MKPQVLVPRRRIRMVFVLMVIAILAMVVQLVRVQFGTYAPVFALWLKVAEESASSEVLPERGLIYDRDGILLATNVPMYYLEVEVRQLTEASQVQIAEVLSRVLDLPTEDLYQQLTRDWVSEGQFRIRLTRETVLGDRWPITIDQVVADMIKGFLSDPDAPDMSGLALVPAPRREYPAQTLAGHILGFVNQQGKGFFGIEGFYDSWLAGRSITVERGYIPPEARLEPNPPAGVNLVLTIDADVQAMVEDILEQAIEDSGAISGQIIVMDPRNGELLAVANWPPLDPNNYEPWLPEELRVQFGLLNPELPLSEQPEIDLEATATPTAEGEAGVEDEPEDDRQPADDVINPAVAGLYEPGSTFKVLTMAAAIDAGVVTPETMFVDTGEIEIGGHTIRNWDGGAWGPQSMVGCLQHSLNVCLAFVANDKLGATAFYEYMQAFGIGKLTGVDMSGEVPGQLRTPRHPRWTPSDLGTNSFGQGVSVTPLQLIAAIGAIANDGVMLQPHIVRAVVGPEGVYWPKPVVLGRPVSSETAATMTAMLTESLAGESSRALVQGYSIAGKTGTAQVVGEFGYDPRWTIASFVGWGPVDDPQFIVLVRIDKPEISPWGSVVAAPVFRQVVERLVVIMEIPPDQVRQELMANADQEE
ncbi:MAG: penicillin-binding protein 2 [Anaerolineales bacterium]